jgi:hypothetical protein
MIEGYIGVFAGVEPCFLEKGASLYTLGVSRNEGDKGFPRTVGTDYAKVIGDGAATGGADVLTDKYVILTFMNKAGIDGSAKK